MATSPTSHGDASPVSPGEVREDLPGLPRHAISEWLASELPQLAAGTSWSAELITGGLSNITYRLTLPDRTLVLRRPPLSGGLPKAHDMVREYTVQVALRSAGFPVAPQHGLCTDSSVIGASFYVMGDIPGEVLRSAATTADLTPNFRQGIGEELVDHLVDLHGLDYEDVGLGSFGRPEGYCQRQIRTWSGQWERSATRQLPAISRLFASLAAAIPKHADHSIVHGDYKIDNVIFDLTGPLPQAAAILDWELSTLGDPLADLGTFLTYWSDSQLENGAAFVQAAGITAHTGFPTAQELAGRYADRSGRSLDHLNFYRALAEMKLAVILEGVHARFLGGQTVGAGYDKVGQAVPELVSRALDRLQR